MASPDVSLPVTESVAKKSIAERFIGIVFSPGETFADIVRKPDFIAPLVAISVASLAVTEVMLAKIGMERIVRMSIEQSGRASNMSREQMQQAVEQGSRIGGIFTHVLGLVAAPIFLLIVAAIGMLIVNVIFGQKTNFKTAFSVTCYANVVGLLGVVMALAMILLGDPEHFNPQNMMPSNPGFFLNPLQTPKPLIALASSFDIFTLWSMTLLGVGFSAATGKKVKTLPIFLTYLGLWTLYVLGKVGLAMLG